MIRDRSDVLFRFLHIFNNDAVPENSDTLIKISEELASTSKKRQNLMRKSSVINIHMMVC